MTESAPTSRSQRPQAAWVGGVCKTCGQNTHSCKCEHPGMGAFASLFAAPQEGAGSTAGPATNGEPAAAAALHASAPEGYQCADCTMDKEPCPACYTAWWTKRHPNVSFIQSETQRSPHGPLRTISEGYQDVFNAIAAAVKIEASAIAISVEKFLANIPTVRSMPSAVAPIDYPALIEKMLFIGELAHAEGWNDHPQAEDNGTRACRYIDEVRMALRSAQESIPSHVAPGEPVAWMKDAAHIVNAVTYNNAMHESVKGQYRPLYTESHVAQGEDLGELLREAADSVQASIADVQDGPSVPRRSYRVELEQRLRAARQSLRSAIQRREDDPLVATCRGLIRYWTRNLRNFQWEKADDHVKRINAALPAATDSGSKV